MKLVALLLLALFAAPLKAETLPSVLVSIAPYKLFVEKIAEDTVSVILMVPAGASAHTYEPTPKQMINASNGQIWFTIGESFEAKASQAIQSHNPKPKIIDLRSGVNIITTDPESGHCCCNIHCQDLHIWLSPIQTKIQIKTIAEGLKKQFPEHAALYEKNLNMLLKELDSLNAFITTQLATLKNRIILVSHPAYAYFCRDFNLKQLSIEFEGKDPTPRQMTRILNQAKDAHIDKILVQPQYSSKGAYLFAKELNAKVIILDPYSEDYFNSLKNIANAISE